MQLTEKHVNERYLNTIIDSCEFLEHVAIKSEVLLKLALEVKQRRSEDRQREATK